MKKRIIYDCEIVRMIPPEEGIRILSMTVGEGAESVQPFGDGYEYCGGWDDFENMGISVIGICDIDTLECQKFLADDFQGFEAFADIAAVSELWGFNSLAFDDKLCQANGIQVKTNYDLLELVRRRAYGSPKWEDQPEGYSYSLRKIASANGARKTGSGELAPKLWQDGYHQEVIDYCLNDCKITAKMIRKLEEGVLVDPNTGKFL